MNWTAIATADARAIWRSNVVRALAVGVVLVLLLRGLTFAIDPPQIPQGTVGTPELMGDLTTTVVIFASLLAVVVTHRAIAGDIETDTIKVFLTSPHTRRELVLAKSVSRAFTTLLPVIIGLCSAAVFAGLLGIPITVGSFMLFVLFSTLFTLSFVGVTLGVSMLAETELEAVAGGIGLFVVIGAGWNVTTTVIRRLWEVVTGSNLGETQPDWVVLLDMIGPAGAYDRLVVELLYTPDSGYFSVHPDPPWYFTEWVPLLVLFVWGVLPLVIGSIVFFRKDL